MTVSSRTPEGIPSRCPLCDARAPIEFSEPAGDATCPNCGCLIWRSADVLDFVRQSIARSNSIPLEDLQPATLFESYHGDSIDFIELVMELEDRYRLVIPDEDYANIRSIGDLVRYVVERWGGEPGS
jgi:acyl carrier protein